MNCGCKKTFCDKRNCKCKKNSVYCSAGCACPPEQCRNRQEAKNEEVEKEENENDDCGLSWEDAQNIAQSWLELMSRERNKATQPIHIPKAIKSILEMQKNIVQEIGDLNLSMANLTLGNVVGEMNIDDYERFFMSLVECRACKRKFAPHRIDTHEKICMRRTFTK
ncbi:hypothetical protein ONE63_005538 [Megalurothrips usitatus]|uniref:CRC domain-containing protein n=1 Tax=Megalurothrips usitatus TaxID=439358 RepID=A0AAV7XZB4_9NEOP|nr:hypothetical protein ONE63_005538 [Megalurothrips usitatus]